MVCGNSVEEDLKTLQICKAPCYHFPDLARQAHDPGVTTHSIRGVGASEVYLSHQNNNQVRSTPSKVDSLRCAFSQPDKLRLLRYKIRLTPTPVSSGEQTSSDGKLFFVRAGVHNVCHVT